MTPHRRDFHLRVAAEDDHGEAIAVRVVAVLVDRRPHVVEHRLALVGGNAERLVEQVDDREPLAAALVLSVGQGEHQQGEDERPQGERQRAAPPAETCQAAVSEHPQRRDQRQKR